MTGHWAEMANRLGASHRPSDPPTQWVDQLWDAAERDEITLPWDRSDPFPAIDEAVAELGPGDGRRAVVVGAALGADAEALAARGWATTAFDVAPAAVRLVRERYPDSAVDYREADLLDLPDDLVSAFDLVIEIFTVQAMPPSARAAAQAGIRHLMAPGGEALVIQYVRGDSDPDEGPPWLLDQAEMEAFGADDVAVAALSVVERDREDRSSDVWFARLRRA